MTENFAAHLQLAAQSFELRVPRGQSRLAGGQIIPFALGASFWTGTMQLVPAYHQQAGEWETDLMTLARPGQVFEVYDARFDGPAGDPGGVILGAAEPVIHELDPDNRHMRLSGLPGGYVLMKGDYLGWSYGPENSRRALHRIKEDVVASGGGLTPQFAVEPFIAPGAAPGLPVRLVRPTCRALIVEPRFGRAQGYVTEGAVVEWQEATR